MKKEERRKKKEELTSFRMICKPWSVAGSVIPDHVSKAHEPKIPFQLCDVTLKQLKFLWIWNALAKDLVRKT
jgi:hypothetical protein